MLCSGPRWETARALPPASAVAGLAGRKEHGPTLPIYDVYYVKPMYPPGGHGRGSLLAPGVFTPGTKPDRGPNNTRTRTRTRPDSGFSAARPSRPVNPTQ